MSDTNGTPGAGWTNGAIPPMYTLQGRLDQYQHRRWIALNSSWSRIGKDDTEVSKRTSNSSAQAIALTSEQQGDRVRALMAQLCEAFYRQNWATGTGGGISIRFRGEQDQWRVFVAPSGLQKEDLIANDMFELDMNRQIVEKPRSNPNLRQSACTPLWYVVYKHRPSATAVVHTHSPNAVYATLIDTTETSKSLKLTHLEMLKGVGNHAYDDVLELPIIDNRPTEDLLAEQFEQAILAYPKANAVLVRRHGLYVWGDSWEQCKTHAESVDYLLGAAVAMKQMGVDPSVPPPSGTYRVETSSSSGPPPAKKLKTGFHGVAGVDNAADCNSNPVPLLPRDENYKVLLLDIEGCTTSISFVKDVLFPFAREKLSEYLKTLDGMEIARLTQSMASELPTELCSTADTTNLERMVQVLMDNDVKAKTLKELQGDIWKAGYTSGELQGHVYSDVPVALDWLSQHMQVFIYSSGSIAAQKLLFGNSLAGDLLPRIQGHFDIPTAGPKKESPSYTKIASALELNPNEIVFVSDSEAELVAAREAGIKAIMSIRPGNAPLTRNDFPSIHSLLQLCGKD